MSLRNRERITRYPDQQQCDACGVDHFDHNISVKRVAGDYLALCVSCRIELKHDRLDYYLAVLDRHNPDMDVNTDLITELHDAGDHDV